MSIYYTAIVFMTAYAMVVLMAAVMKNSFMSQSQKRGFMVLCVLLIVTNIAEWLAAYLDGGAESMRILHFAAKFTELSLTPLIPAVIILAASGEKISGKLYIPAGINLVLQIISIFTGIVFSLDGNNLYHRGPFYLIYVATFVCSIIILVIFCIKFSKSYQYRNFMLLSMILIFALAAVLLPFIDRELRLDWACISIGTIVFYIYYNELVQQVDALTGLLNRRSFNHIAEEMKSRSVILFFDVDHFKKINDEYGHGFGDIVLSSLAGAIKTFFAKYGHSYRFGGDEFCVTMDIRYSDITEELISNFLRSLDGIRKKEPRLPHISVGYAFFDPANEEVENALDRADSMMYIFKHRNEVIRKN